MTTFEVRVHAYVEIVELHEHRTMVGEPRIYAIDPPVVRPPSERAAFQCAQQRIDALNEALGLPTTDE